MSGSEKVLLMELRERVSSAGNRYLSGWLGKASVVAFLDRDADETTWQFFVSAPASRSNGGQAAAPSSPSPLAHSDSNFLLSQCAKHGRDCEKAVPKRLWPGHRIPRTRDFSLRSEQFTQARLKLLGLSA